MSAADAEGRDGRDGADGRDGVGGAEGTSARGGKAREAGAATVAALRRATARKAGELIRSDPDDAATRPAKPLTVVFTDLEGFTAYTDAHGDAAALTLIATHHQRAAPTVRRWKGRIVKHLGDGLLCTFPAPAAGVRAALDLQASSPEPLRLRAGVHMGKAVVTRTDVVGHVVNVAARVCEAAKGGQVLVTADVLQEVSPDGGLADLRLGRMKSRRMKGVKAPVRLCEVRAAPERALGH